MRDTDETESATEDRFSIAPPPVSHRGPIGRSLGSERHQMAAVVALILLISVLHYATVTTLPILHDLYRRLYYVPVGLAALWFGLRGAILSSLLVTALYVPHILLDWHHMSRELANQFMEIAVYFGFSALIGHFAARERRYRVRCEETAEKLERSYQELRQQADLILEIEGQLRRADRLAAVGELAATITHEIRNPLTSISAAVEILKDDRASGAERNEFLDILQRETQRLNQVVEGYLGFARPRGGEEAALLDAGGLIREMERLVGPQATQAGRRLAVRVDGPLPVRGNRVHLKQVLLNLLLNALQAAPPGGEVRLSGQVREGVVKGLEFRDVQGQLVEIAVEDDGPGIPDAVASRIFSPFFTTKPEGTGLGLAISLRIAEAHGGTLAAKNLPGGGARFTLTLPAAPAPAVESSEADCG